MCPSSYLLLLVRLSLDLCVGIALVWLQEGNRVGRGVGVEGDRGVFRIGLHPDGHNRGHELFSHGRQALVPHLGHILRRPHEIGVIKFSF